MSQTPPEVGDVGGGALSDPGIAGGERTVERSAHYTTSAQAFPWAVNESGRPAELEPLIDATIIDHDRLREIVRLWPTPRIDAA